jgi:hypothetical protein
MTVSSAYRKLCTASGADLERLFQRGTAPDPAALAGYDYRGYNHPRRMALLRARKFAKGFAAHADGVIGYNMPVVQNGLDGEWITRPDPNRPKHFGFFRVTPVDPQSRDNAHLHALLLDYGAADNPRLSVVGAIRDYLVSVDAGSVELLLGKAYLAIGPARIDAHNFFVIERWRPASGG